MLNNLPYIAVLSDIDHDHNHKSKQYLQYFSKLFEGTKVLAFKILGKNFFPIRYEYLRMTMFGYVAIHTVPLWIEFVESTQLAIVHSKTWNW